MAVLISGNPGSGKSTLTAELLRRGISARDADGVPGLAAWMNADGAVIGDGSLAPTPELLATCYWGWSERRLGQLIEELGPTGVLLGIAVNQWAFIDLFDTVILLEVDPATQRERVASRDQLFQKQIVAGLPVFQAQMTARGAVRIDASRPVEDVADEVAALLGGQP